jgi:uncharacterized protein (TIGR02588 family)
LKVATMKLPEKNWLEWSVFAVGLLLVVGVIVYLAYDAVTLGDRPPSIEVQLGEPEQRANAYAIPVSVTNLGDQTAEGVLIEVVLERGTDREQAQFEIAFVPRYSTRQGWVMFQTDPRSADQVASYVLGFESP